MSFDLDINNYNFNELLNLFKLNSNYTEKDVIKIKNKCDNIKQKYDFEIHNFYVKAYKIIEIILYLVNDKTIKYKEDVGIIKSYVDKIKAIEGYENYSSDKLLQKLNSFLHNSYETDVGLNTSNFDTNSKPNPSLNDKNNTNYIINSYPNSIAPGNLNSIKRITLFQNLHFNSCFRNNYYTSTSTDFQYILPSEIKNVVAMRLASIEIPNTWYLFSYKQNNNIFKIIIKPDINCDSNHDLNSKTYTITIPDGNYDNETLEHYLNTTYFYQSNSDNCLKFIKYSIDQYSFKSKFEILDLTECNICDFTFTLVFLEDMNDNLRNTAGWIFGFRQNIYIGISNRIESEGLFDGGGDKYIYMVLTDYQYNTNNTNIIGFDKSIMEEDVLAKIPMMNGKLSLIIDDNINPLIKMRKYNGPVNIKKIHVKIIDKFGNIIDLNYMDFSFTLEFELLYESFNFKDVFA